MKGTETETAEAGKQKVDSKNLGEIESWFSRPWVLPDFEVPEGPVPNRGKHQQATENVSLVTKTHERKVYVNCLVWIENETIWIPVPFLFIPS